MSYKQTNWADHVVERPKTYMETVNSDGSKTFADAPGEIIQQGTPMSATNFNHIEEGIGNANATIDLLLVYIQTKLGHSDYTMEELEAALRTSIAEKLGLHATAEAASKLATPRKIGITGGATGAGVNFDGSVPIDIAITALDPTKLSAAVPINKGGTGATDTENARTNLDVPANTVIRNLVVLVDAMQSVNQATQRAQESRIITLEAQVAALT